jgi:hypothetical protein
LKNLLDRLDGWARRLTAIPSLLLKLLVGATVLSLVSAFIGLAIFGWGDQHQLFRDVGPIQLWSLLQTLTVAILGLLIARRTARYGDWRDANNFWLLAGIGFLWLTIDAPLDLHGKIGGLLADATGSDGTAGFHRWSDFILFAYMVGGLLLAAIYWRDWLPFAELRVLFLAGAVLIGLTIAIDGFVDQTSTIWVIEETLKLYGGAFFVATFAVRYRMGETDEAATEAADATAPSPSTA